MIRSPWHVAKEGSTLGKPIYMTLRAAFGQPAQHFENLQPPIAAAFMLLGSDLIDALGPCLTAADLLEAVDRVCSRFRQAPTDRRSPAPNPGVRERMLSAVDMASEASMNKAVDASLKEKP